MGWRAVAKVDVCLGLLASLQTIVSVDPTRLRASSTLSRHNRMLRTELPKGRYARWKASYTFWKLLGPAPLGRPWTTQDHCFPVQHLLAVYWTLFLYTEGS